MLNNVILSLTQDLIFVPIFLIRHCETALAVAAISFFFTYRLILYNVSASMYVYKTIRVEIAMLVSMVMI